MGILKDDLQDRRDLMLAGVLQSRFGTGWPIPLLVHLPIGSASRENSRTANLLGDAADCLGFRMLVWDRLVASDACHASDECGHLRVSTPLSFDATVDATAQASDC